MGTIIDSILAYKDSLTGSAFEALTAASGDSFALRWFKEGTKVHLLDTWGGNNATLCEFSIRSPLLHDNTRGIRFKQMFNPTLSGADGNPQLHLAPYWRQELTPTDTLIVEANGAASDDVTFCLCIKYDVPGDQSARFLTHSEVLARTKNLVGISVSPVPAASTSTWGVSEVITTDDDRLKANTDYALLGATSDLPFTAMKIWGPDTGNFGIPLPGTWRADTMAGWFYEMSRRWNEPLIPVFNSNNKSVTNTALAQVGGGTAPTIALQFAQLG